jgi:Flp pilus assembly protein TadG
MLIQIAFFILMLFGVAALSIDLGLARLWQSQMQNAADTAALEGLRQRDAAPNPTDCDPNRDTNRRCLAANMAAWAFDPALVPMPTGGTGDSEIAFTDNGETDYMANQKYDAQTSSVYKPPRLQSNLTNEINGDMVSGTYGPSSAAYACPVIATDPHWEDCQYNRKDFTAADAAGSATASSFLVRLRRTDHRNDALDRVDGVSKSGESVPLLFGRGTFVQPNGNAATYSPRRDGLTVRATAIANSRPALSIGAPDPVTHTPGVTTASLSLGCWENLVTGSSVALSINCMNILPLTASPAQTVGAVVIPFAGTLSDTDPVAGGGYLPIFDPNTNRIVGFGFAQITHGVNGVEVMRLKRLATANASAVVRGGLRPGPDLATAMQNNTELAAMQDFLLVAAMSR